MNLFFKRLLWPSLVLAMIELIYAHSQSHWLLVTAVFAVMNASMLVGLCLIVPRLARRPLP